MFHAVNQSVGRNEVDGVEAEVPREVWVEYHGTWDRPNPVCRCKPGACALEHPVTLSDTEIDVTDLLPFGVYFGAGLEQWEQVPLRVKKILSVAVLRVYGKRSFKMGTASL